MSDALKPIEAVERVMTRLYEAGRVDAAFGQPIERGGTTIIPCAEVAIGLGMGAGGGLSPTEDEGEAGGGGSGGGGGAKSRPVAAIIIDSSGVHVEPIVDVTKIGLALFTAAAFVLFWLARLLSSTRPADDDETPSLKALTKAVDA